MEGAHHGIPATQAGAALHVETLLRSVAEGSCTSAASMSRLQARPLEALASVERTPDDAAAAYFVQRRGGGPFDEGWVRLQWHGEDLSAPELWESVGMAWGEILGAVAVLLDASDDARSHCVQLIEEDGRPRMRFIFTGGGVVAMGLGSRRLFGTPQDVLSPLLAGARRWLTFCRDELGLRPNPPLDVLYELDELLSRHHRLADTPRRTRECGHFTAPRTSRTF